MDCVVDTWICGGGDMFVQHSQIPSSGKKGVTRPGILRSGIAACSIILGFCTSILIAHTLGPAGFGIYTFVLWLATVGTPAIGVGMSTLTSRHIIEIQSHQAPRVAAGVFSFIWQRQYRSILLYCLIYLLLIFPFSWFFGANAPIHLLLLAGFSVPPLLLSVVAGITLRSLRRFNLLAIISLLGAVTGLLMVSMVVQVQGEHIGLLLLASATASIFTLSVALLCIMRLLPVGQALSPGPFLKDRLTRGLNNSLLLFTLDVIVWQPSELIWLAHWRGSTELAFYALSSMLAARFLDLAPMLFSTWLLPILVRYIPSQRYTNAYDAFIKASRFVAFLAVLLCVLAILFCPLLIEYCFGRAYLPVVIPLRILLISAAFGSVSTVSLTHLANGERKQAQVWLGIGSAVLNIVLALPFIIIWGAIGAALASAIAQIISATGSIIICKRLITYRFYIKSG
jgi:O-antigen/teichoic acid export membrane protein